MTTRKQLELVIITGMSGAGKTVAIQCFEDMGYFCVDNLPPSLFTKLWEVVQQAGTIDKVALVIDIRSGSFFKEFASMIESAKNDERVDMRILFLEANDKVLVARYKENRRSHPMSPNGSIIDGIQKERELLKVVHQQATTVIDTSSLSAKELKEQIINGFKNENVSLFSVTVESFGFKYGLPIDADIVMDVRFLPNPYYIEELRVKTGQDQAVYDYVMSFEETNDFYERFIKLLDLVVPGYKKEGRRHVTIAIGCTGGQHRSVALTERVARSLQKDGYLVQAKHRDAKKSQESVIKNANK